MATNQKFLLVAVSNGYQLNNAVGNFKLRLVLTFQLEQLNFMSSSEKKFHRTNIESRVPFIRPSPKGTPLQECPSVVVVVVCRGQSSCLSVRRSVGRSKDD